MFSEGPRAGTMERATVKKISEKKKPSPVGGTTAITRKAKIFPATPSDWLSVESWADRAGVSPRVFRKYISEGAIADRWLAKVNTPRGMKLIVEWDHCSYAWIMSRDPLIRPADFFENDAGVYKPIKAVAPIPAPGVQIGPPMAEYNAERLQRPLVTDVAIDESGNEVDPVGDAVASGDLLSGNMLSMRVVDLPTARFRQQQLKIMKDQIDLKVARGEVMKIKDVENMLMEIATDIKGQFVQLVARYAPALAACSDPREVRRTLEDALKDAIEPLTAKNGTP